MKKKDILFGTRAEAERFATLCNLLETMWYMKKPWEVDTEDLIPFTSPQARRIAGFIEELYA